MCIKDIVFRSFLMPLNNILKFKSEMDEIKDSPKGIWTNYIYNHFVAYSLTLSWSRSLTNYDLAFLQLNIIQACINKINILFEFKLLDY